MKQMKPTLKAKATLLAGAVVSALCALPMKTVQAQQVALDVALGTPAVLAGQRQTAYLKVSLTGFELRDETIRPAANIAIVLDKSGSMNGDKIERAKDAASMAIERLNSADIAAIVSYDSTVRINMPATKVTDKKVFRDNIKRIYANGNTALFAGVSKGAYEVQKFLQRERVNRVILLSDGLANVGPSSPAALGRLGASLGKQGISVTTIGLGLDYNEDLMTRLAGMSDGNHAFAETGNDLAKIFDAEFGNVLSVVAQEVTVKIRCLPGVRPIRVLGRDATIIGQTVAVNLHQLYGEQEKFVVLEVELPAGEEGLSQQIAKVNVDYFNTVTRRQDKLAGTAQVQYTVSERVVEEELDEEVMTDTVQQIANEMSKEAVELRDAGRVREAQQRLQESAAYLEQNARQYNAPGLESLSGEFARDAEAIGKDEEWKKTRKVLKKRQYSVEIQQTY